MEKKTTKKQQQTNDSLPKGYYIAVNHKIIDLKPISKEDAINLFKTLESIMRLNDDKVYVGFNIIITPKVVVELIWSEFLEDRVKDVSEESKHPTEFPTMPFAPPTYPHPHYVPSFGDPTCIPKNPFAGPFDNSPFVPFVCNNMNMGSSIKPEEAVMRKAKEDQFFKKCQVDTNTVARDLSISKNSSQFVAEPKDIN